VAVTAGYVEFISTVTLAEEAGVVPGVAGLQIYSASKRLIYLESDQEIAVKINGDTSERLRLEPWIAADTDRVASFIKTGATFSLSVKNRSTTRAKVQFISVE